MKPIKNRKSYSTQITIYVNRCIECGDPTEITLRKVKPGLCKNCSNTYTRTKQSKPQIITLDDET